MEYYSISCINYCSFVNIYKCFIPKERTMFGEEYVILTNPRNTQSGINRYPERLPYGNSAVIGNPDVKEAYGDGSYIYSEKTWINGDEF